MLSLLSGCDFSSMKTRLPGLCYCTGSPITYRQPQIVFFRTERTQPNTSQCTTGLVITCIWSLAQHYPYLAQPGPNHWATIFCINIHFITAYCIFIYVIILYIVFLLYIIYPGPMAQAKNDSYREKIKNKKLFFFIFFSLYRRTVFPLKFWAIGPAVPQTRHLRAFPASSSPGSGPNLGNAGPVFCSAGPKKAP